MIGFRGAAVLLLFTGAADARTHWFVNDDGDAQSPKAVENDRTFLLYLCEPGGGGQLNPDGDLLALVSYAVNFESTTAVVNGRPTTAMPRRVSGHGMLCFADAAPGPTTGRSGGGRAGCATTSERRNGRLDPGLQ